MRSVRAGLVMWLVAALMIVGERWSTFGQEMVDA